MTTRDHIVGKLSSGRWIATIAACIIWAMLAYRDRLSPEFHGGTITLVIASYFQRKRAEDSE
jgi:hypothetical protein